MDTVLDFLFQDTNVLGAAIISAVVSGLISYLVQTRQTRYRLAAEYEYEQRKQLRSIIGRYHGRLLNAANSLNYRLWNLSRNHRKNWLCVNGGWGNSGYYFTSTVHRFLTFFGLVRSFEKEAVIADARIAERRDFHILQYAAALHWCMTDPALFEGLSYDSTHATDHFFSDQLRQCCDRFLEIPESLRDSDRLATVLQQTEPLHSICGFFDSLEKDECRLRWDRLMALHLLLAAFINTIGYAEHRTSMDQMAEIARRVNNKPVLKNLVSWLPRHGLHDFEAKCLAAVCNRVVSGQ